MADSDIPAVIASHVDIRYTVFGAGSGKGNAGATSAVGRILNGARTQVGSREVHAVKDVSFVAHQGESIGLIGRNGSGKSTLLRSIAGLIPPSSGDIYLNGKAALLGVNAVLIRQLSGARNIMIGGQALGLSRREVQARFAEIVEFADIGDFIDLPMSSYSSGMAARLRFAISTAAVPDILVVDEALATGDAQFKARAQERIQQIRQSAGTIFMVNHSPAVLKTMCTRGMWLENGQLIMDGPVAEVARAYALKYPQPRRKTKRKPLAPGAEPPPKPRVDAPPEPDAEQALTPPAAPSTTPDTGAPSEDAPGEGQDERPDDPTAEGPRPPSSEPPRTLPPS